MTSKGLMMKEDRQHLSGEAFEQLLTWLHAHCVCALENPEFLPGLIVIIEMEVERALKKQCCKAARTLKPCSN
jgi:hypothetical protein